MTAAALTLAVIALTVAVIYAVLNHDVRPSWLARLQTGSRDASRDRDQRALPPPAPRPAALPEAQALAWALRTHAWESTAETPELAAMSAHIKHGYYPGCKVCTGDTFAMAQVALDAIASQLGEVSP